MKAHNISISLFIIVHPSAPATTITKMSSLSIATLYLYMRVTNASVHGIVFRKLIRFFDALI